MDTALISLAIAILLAAAGLAFFLNKKFEEMKTPADDNSQKLMLEVIENLRREISHSSGEARKENMKTLDFLENRFSNLNKSVEAKIADNTKRMDERLDGAAKVIAKVSGELGKMAEIRGSVESLTNFLRHGKRRGNLGEEGLTELLRESLPNEKWKLQHAFRSGESVDAVIETKNGLIPIDSKFPLENFERLTSAESDSERDAARHEFSKDMKKHIDAIARKYIRTDEGTVDFAICYLPAESIYNEASENEVIAKFAREKKVQLVGPNSLFYFLRVVLLAYQSERFEENAKKVLAAISGVRTEAGKFGEILSVTAKHVGNANTKMNEAVAGYQKLSDKIDRVSEFGETLPASEDKKELE